MSSPSEPYGKPTEPSDALSEAGTVIDEHADEKPKPAVEDVEGRGRGGAPARKSDKTRLAFSKLVPAGVSYQVVFWICALWLFGSLYKCSEKTHNLHIVVADFDGGSVGSALLSAVSSTTGPSTAPTYVVLPASSTSPEDIQKKVFDGKYWGGVWAAEGATSRFEAAVNGGGGSYNASEAIYYTGLEVRYNTVWTGYVLTAITKLVALTTATFNRESVAPLLTASSTSYSSSAAAVLVNPIGSTYVDQTPFKFGTRIVINTLGYVFPTLFCFFFLMALNSIGALTGWYKNMSVRRHLKFRISIGAVWTLLSSLSVMGWFLMFSESYTVGASSFFALWAMTWVYCMITYDLLDVMTAYVPPQFLSHLLVLYIMTGVAAVLFPLDLMSPFFKIQYALPSHSTWGAMITAFGHGAVNRLHIDLPILAAWFVVTKVALVFSIRRRARLGRETVTAVEKDKH
ncbi:hypothetical protein JCM8547_007254 [Rhodosporidiobolus lusitaniae]